MNEVQVRQVSLTSSKSPERISGSWVNKRTFKLFSSYFCFPIYSFQLAIMVILELDRVLMYVVLFGNLLVLNHLERSQIDKL